MKRTTILYLGFIVIGIALVLTALMLFSPTTMNVTDTTGSEISQSNNGDAVEFVGQVTEITGNILTVEVLQSKDGTNFDQRTGQFIYVVVETTPEYVMGTEADIKVGVLGQFRGTKINDHQMNVDRIVILSGYINGPAQ